MARTKTNLAAVDPVWSRIVEEAECAVAEEPLLGGLIHSSLLHHRSLERALSYRIALKLASGEMDDQLLREVVDDAFVSEPGLGIAARADIVAVYERDPACHRLMQPVLYFKGYQALQAYRVGHWLWTEGRQDMAYFVQARVSEVFGIDIHPAARIGKGIMIDHAHSIVIGETAVVGDNVSMLHSVTLGGTGKGRGPSPEDRLRRTHRGGRQGARQHQGRGLQPDRGGVRRARGRAAEKDRCGRARACCRRGRLHPARGDHGPSSGRLLRRLTQRRVSRAGRRPRALSSHTCRTARRPS